MPNARIEIESVRNPNGECWHGEIEAGPPMRRRVINTGTFEECVSQLVSMYNEIRPDGAPTQLAQQPEAPAAPTVQGDDLEGDADELPTLPQTEKTTLKEAPLRSSNGTKESPHSVPPRRGRHPNDCPCERCAAKNAALSA